MKGNPHHRSGSQFAFTCLMMISVFRTFTVHAAHSWESPSFKIERKVNLEAIVSCGEGMLQGKHDSICRLSADEGTVWSLWCLKSAFIFYVSKLLMEIFYPSLTALLNSIIARIIPLLTRNFNFIFSLFYDLSAKKKGSINLAQKIKRELPIHADR